VKTLFEALKSDTPALEVSQIVEDAATAALNNVISERFAEAMREYGFLVEKCDKVDEEDSDDEDDKEDDSDDKSSKDDE